MGLAARSVFWNKNCHGNNFVSLPILTLVNRTQKCYRFEVSDGQIRNVGRKKGGTKDNRYALDFPSKTILYCIYMHFLNMI
jgi:hypothetical protein